MSTNVIIIIIIIIVIIIIMFRRDSWFQNHLAVLWGGKFKPIYPKVLTFQEGKKKKKSNFRKIVPENIFHQYNCIAKGYFCVFLFSHIW